MKYWIIVFTPETYEAAKKKSLIGVRTSVKKRFEEIITEGDIFVTYVSRQVLFDGYGKISGKAFVDETPIFGENPVFPCRRKVTFEKAGLKKPAKEIFWGIEPFNTLNTSPGNYLLLKGGFVEISKNDYNWLMGELGK